MRVKLFILTIAILSLISMGMVYAACSVNLDVVDKKETYKPYDMINLTATGGYPGEGSMIFYLINPSDQQVGQTESIGVNETGHANTYFKVGNGWAKGTYQIKVDYSKGSCSTSKIVEVELDTFTVPMLMNISANFSLQNVSACQNVTGANVTYQICIDGQVPTGFTWNLASVNTSQIQEEIGNITVSPSRPTYPFEFVKQIQDRMTDAIYQGNQITDANSRMSSTILNQSSYLIMLENENKQLKDGIINSQLQYWQTLATNCQTNLNNASAVAKNQGRSSGFWTGAAIFFFIGLIIGIAVIWLFVWLKSRGDDLGGYRY